MSAPSPYRTLLALHPADEPPERLGQVEQLARAFDAHVDAWVLEPMSPLPTMGLATPPTYWWDEVFTKMIERTEQRGREIAEWLEERGVEATVTAEAVQLGLVGERVSRAALHSDLVVLRGARSLVSGLMGRALEGVLFGAGKPALVLEAGAERAPTAPRQVVIAWDGGREAARSVQLAVPLLREAGSVRVAVVEPEAHGELARDADALARQLGRHGVDVRIERVAPRGRTVAEALVEHVERRRPDLLVMGAYGHARIREWLLSGPTRAALTELETPLFLAH